VVGDASARYVQIALALASGRIESRTVNRRTKSIPRGLVRCPYSQLDVRGVQNESTECCGLGDRETWYRLHRANTKRSTIGVAYGASRGWLCDDFDSGRIERVRRYRCALASNIKCAKTAVARCVTAQIVT